MILKTRDASAEAIARLERGAGLEADPVRRAALAGAASRLRADSTTEDACALIDRDFGAAEEWVVLHDLRLGVGTGTLHLNHLLVSDRLECVCVDTRYLRRGLEPTGGGGFRAFDARGSLPVASPLAKAARDVRLLRALLAEAQLLPRRFGIGPRATLRGVVLTDPSLRIGVPFDERRDAVGVVPADGLFPMLWKRRHRTLGPFERLSRDDLASLCEGIARLHRPSVPQALTGMVAERGPRAAAAAREARRERPRPALFGSVTTPLPPRYADL